MMEPAELQTNHQQQPQTEYAKKVNEMQTLLPSLEKYLTKTTTLKSVKDEDVQKLKLLQRVLSGQENTEYDSLTLDELKKYAAMLSESGNAETQTMESTKKLNYDVDNDDAAMQSSKEENILTNGNITDNNVNKDVKKEETVHKSLLVAKETALNKAAPNVQMNEKEDQPLESDIKRDVGTQEKSEITDKVQNTEESKNEVSLENDTLRKVSSTNDSAELKEGDSKSATNDTPKAHQNVVTHKTEEEKNIENELAPFEKTQAIVSDGDTVGNFETADDFDDIEYEGIELIKIPEDTAEDEMILPDSADEADFKLHLSEDEAETEADEEHEEEEAVEEEQEEVGGRKEQKADNADGLIEEEEQEKAENDEAKVSRDEEAKQKGEDQDGGEECTEHQALKSTMHIEDSEESVQSENIVQEQEEITLASNSNSHRGTNEEENSINKNENENDDTCDHDDADDDVQEIETVDTEESNSLPPAEIAVEMDSQSGHDPHNETTNCDDPLGQEVEEDGQNEVNQSRTAENVESSNREKNDETNEIQTRQKVNKNNNNKNSTQNVNLDDEDDDDEVEIIETRNSPICLDTDDDEDPEASSSITRTITDTNLRITAYATHKHTNTRIVTATKAAATASVNQNKRTTRTSNTTTETIDLLDSSDEENGRPNRRPTKSPFTISRSLAQIPGTNKKGNSISAHQQQSPMTKKRTLLPKASQTQQKSLKISQVLSGAAVPVNCRAYNTPKVAPDNKTAEKTPKSVLVFPPTSFKPTPQSNFLNAVNLLPTAATTGDNPLAFSATLSNKNIIIPNAFYANRLAVSSNDNKTSNSGGSKNNNRNNTRTEKEEETSAKTKNTNSNNTLSKVPTITVTHQQERIYREWLEEFIDNFANPQQIASHTCLVLLQSALKYKAFARIKELRTALNTKAYTSNGIADGQLTRELHHNFYTHDCRLTNEGFRFCAAACTQIGCNVTLMTDACTGRITLRTSAYEDLAAKYAITNGGGGGGSGSGTGGGGASYDDKRKRYKGDSEYMPAKYYEKKVEQQSGTKQGGERRKSLRQHRTPRCYDETYLYEPDEAEVDDNSGERGAAAGTSNKRRQEAHIMDLVQRKAEEKRLEAKRQREQQVKSFESAYLEMFANTLRGKNVVNGTAAEVTTTAENSECSMDNNSNSAQQIIIDDDEEDNYNADAASLEEDGEPRSHRIYKVVPTRLLAATTRPDSYAEQNTSSSSDTTIPTAKSKRGRPRKQDFSHLKSSHYNSNVPELITCDSNSGDSAASIDYNNRSRAARAPGVTETSTSADDNSTTVPKNVNVNWHSSNDWCRICNVRVPRTVAHYVNEHPTYEVYNSRIQKNILARLRKEGGQILQKRPYMNGQEQHAGDCVFCNKTCCFKITYWYQHYAMHTGEYAYRCSGCNTRKPTRSAMMVHINQPCRKRGKLIEDYTYNSRAKYIEVRVCKLCNYTQLNRRNVLQHLRTQHGAIYMQKKNIESIVLLRMPEPEVDEMLEDAKEFMDLSSGGEDGGTADGENNSNQMMAMTFNYDNFDEMGADGGGGMWDDGDPTDDLSYMICGMLDVEMRNDEQ